MVEIKVQWPRASCCQCRPYGKPDFASRWQSPRNAAFWQGELRKIGNRDNSNRGSMVLTATAACRSIKNERFFLSPGSAGFERSPHGTAGWQSSVSFEVALFSSPSRFGRVGRRPPLRGGALGRGGPSPGLRARLSRRALVSTQVFQSNDPGSPLPIREGKSCLPSRMGRAMVLIQVNRNDRKF